MVDAAKRQEDNSLSAFRTIFDAAQKDADRAEHSRLRFRRKWSAIVDFRLTAFDLAGADRVTIKAMELGLPGAQDVAFDIARIRREVKDFEGEIERARNDLLSSDCGTARSANVPVVLVSSTCLQRNRVTPRASEIRTIYRAIFSALKENGISYATSFRVSGHGAPLVPRSTKYFSYHTIDLSGQGLHFKSTDRPGCYSFDQTGYSGWATFGRAFIETEASEETIEQFFNEDRRRIIDSNISKYPQPESTATQLPKDPWIFVALQTINDAVQELACVPMLQMLEEVTAHAKSLGIPVVVKRHPHCRSSKVSAALSRGTRKGLFTLSDASIHQLISGSVAVCVVNSSVGAEALLHLKPVYLFGRAEYQEACVRVGSPGTFARVFRPNTMPIAEPDVKRFLYRLRNEFAVDLSQPSASEEIERRIKIFLSPSACEKSPVPHSPTVLLQDRSPDGAASTAIMRCAT